MFFSLYTRDKNQKKSHEKISFFALNKQHSVYMTIMLKYDNELCNKSLKNKKSEPKDSDFYK